MAGIGLVACAGGRARRRRVLRPAHGGIVQLNSMGSFTGGQGCRRQKESTNGLPCSSVYVRRRPVEVRRCQSGVSGEVVLGLWARGSSLSSGEASRGVRRGGGGLEWPVYGGRGSHGRWHAVLWVNAGELMLGQGWERAGAYGRGQGWLYSHGRARGRVPGRALVLPGHVEHVAVLICPSLAPAEHPNVRILPYELCKISCLHLELSSLCEFQGEIRSGLEDMVVPSLVCLHCSSRDKTDAKPCQTTLVWLLFVIWTKGF
jgi:hypothetical protein